MWVSTEYCDQKIVLDATQSGGGAVAGILNGAKMIVFINNITLTKTTALADLDVGTGAIATPQALTWSAANRDEAGNIGTDSDLISWQLGVGDDPVTIKGVGIVDSGGTNLLLAVNLPAPFPLNDTLDSMDVVARWLANNPDNAGGVTVM